MSPTGARDDDAPSAYPTGGGDCHDEDDDRHQLAAWVATQEDTQRYRPYFTGDGGDCQGDDG